MKRKKSKMMGTVALSVLVASSLSSPMVALAADTTSVETKPAAVITQQSAASTSGESTTVLGTQNGGDVQQTPQQGEQNKTTVDPKTTAPNNVNTAVPSDDKQGSDISYSATGKIWGFTVPLANSTATITTDDANSDKTLGDVSQDFQGTGFGAVKAGDLVIKGDMSIDDDTTKDAAHNVEKDSKHDIKADLDVSAIHTAIEKSGSLLSSNFGGSDAANNVYVNNLETGLRSTFKFGNDLNGEFYVPISLEDAQEHYILSSADDSPLIYRINYANSTFTKDNVSILMDLDLTQMPEFKTTYTGAPSDTNKTLYGESGIKENFNHTDKEYGDTYNTSTFGNLKQLITKSAIKISLLLKDVTFHSATGNKNTTETDTQTTTTTQGSIDGTLVGYMKADVGHNRVKGNVSYVWGAMQDPAGKDVNATDDKVMLTAQFTETTPKESPNNPGTPDNPGDTDNPGTPVNPGGTDNPSTPVNPNNPVNPVTPVNPDNPVTPVTPTNPTTDDGVIPNKPTNPTNTPTKPQKDNNQKTNSGDQKDVDEPSGNSASTKTVTSNTQNPKAVATKTAASAETSNVPKTADETRVGTMLILFGGAAALLTVLLAVKKRENE